MMSRRAAVAKLAGLDPAVAESVAYNAIRVAQLHECMGSMPSSARVAAENAEACFERGDYVSALARALDSLAYSVGVFSPVYRQVAS